MAAAGILIDEPGPARWMDGRSPVRQRRRIVSTETLSAAAASTGVRTVGVVVSDGIYGFYW